MENLINGWVFKEKLNISCTHDYISQSFSIKETVFLMIIKKEGSRLYHRTFLDKRISYNISNTPDIIDSFKTLCEDCYFLNLQNFINGIEEIKKCQH